MPSKEVECLYSVFAAYGRPARLDGCPCCTSPAEAQLLVNKPLRALTVPELEHYAFKALTTWGTLDDYKYFLPRILELTGDGTFPCDTEVTLRKLHYGAFHGWPSAEQQAVRDFIFALWQETVQMNDTDRADAVLCGAAPALADISALLEHADATSPGFKLAYAAGHSNQTKRKLLNSFWERDTIPYRQVMSWLYPDHPERGLITRSNELHDTANASVRLNDVFIPPASAATGRARLGWRGI